MFESLDKINWDLLNRQKLMLLDIRAHQADGSPEREALSGIIHLLDGLQEEAVAANRWAFPHESKGGA